MVQKRILIIIAAIVVVFLAGTVGYMMIEGWSSSEALYMTIITISTVGFQEVRPLSDGGRVFTGILILCGIMLIAAGVNFIFSSIIEGTFVEVIRRQRMEKKVSKMKDHFIICGLGVVGEDIVQEFIHAEAKFVIVEKEREVLQRFLNEYPKMPYVIGDATHDDELKSAGIEKARGIIAAIGNDADNLYICLTARSLNPRLRIISRVLDSSSTAKLTKAGADYVFSPEKIGGIHLAAAALKPTVMSFLDTILRGESVNVLLDGVTVRERSAVAGKTLREAAISRNIGIVIPAIKPSGRGALMFNPSPDSIINVGDTLIGFGTPEQLKKLRTMCT